MNTKIEYCEICNRPKAVDEWNTPLCCCKGLQTYAISVYPGEHKLVPSHPGNRGDEQWYKREDVDAKLEEMEKRVSAQPNSKLTDSRPTATVERKGNDEEPQT